MSEAAAVPPAPDTPLLEVRDLCTYFFTRRGVVKAVDGVSFTLRRGETLALVGESGSGKSITCHSILGLVPKPAGHIVGGEIRFEGRNLLELSERQLRTYRGRLMSMILQDPMSSLNPVYTVGSQVGEAIRIHQGLRGASLLARIREILGRVRIPSPEVRMNNYPHHLSGGMRQRVVGAISLSCEPDLLIADEPTTSLDLTIQAQYLQLLKELQAQLGFALIFITHDFGIVARVCDRAAVMYGGRIVEQGPVRTLFDAPSHPYTQALLRSLPRMGNKARRLDYIDGQPPSLLDPPEGCTFAPRCPEAAARCRAEYPPHTELAPGHAVRCWQRMEADA